MVASKKKVCRDCSPGTPLRKAGYPGPRCLEHHRAFVKAQRDRAHDRRVEQAYGLAPGEYQELLDFQGGVCALCKRPFATKRGAVDHNHKTGRVRGIIHGWENTLVGRIHDSLDWARALVEYLEQSPAERAGLDRKPGD